MSITDVRPTLVVPRRTELGTTNRGAREMLLYEILARTRMREAEEAARRHRMARLLVVRRRWARLARYAAERADRAQRLMGAGVSR
jgi:hypothetical protein